MEVGPCEGVAEIGRGTKSLEERQFRNKKARDLEGSAWRDCDVTKNLKNAFV